MTKNRKLPNNQDDVYKKTDEVLSELRKKYIRLFYSIGSTASFDEVHILDKTKTLYDEAEKLAMQGYEIIATEAYKAAKSDHAAPKKKDIALMIAALLAAFGPVTKFVYNHEVDRKQSRLYESLLAPGAKRPEIKKALHLWNNQVTEMAVEITDAARVKAFKDDGYDYVEWYAELDRKTCPVCRRRHGKTYRIDRIPPKPHWNCRCFTVPKK